MYYGSRRTWHIKTQACFEMLLDYLPMAAPGHTPLAVQEVTCLISVSLMDTA